MEDARKLLDSLMGGHRNADRKVAQAKKGTLFMEDNVCKYYLMGFCPQHEDLFHSTKRDIGFCSKLHSEAMKTEMEEHPETERYQAEYGRLLLNYLESLVRGANDWAAREKRNIAIANETSEANGPNAAAQREIKALNDQAAAYLAEAEDFADRNMIEESKARVALSNEFKQKALEYEEKAKTTWANDVCELCGSRMESGDPSKAKFRHEDGKIHMGFQKIRKWLANLKEKQHEREKRAEMKKVERAERQGKGDARERSRTRGENGRERETERGSRRGGDPDSADRESGRDRRARSVRGRDEVDGDDRRNRSERSQGERRRRDASDEDDRRGRDRSIRGNDDRGRRSDVRDVRDVRDLRDNDYDRRDRRDTGGGDEYRGRERRGEGRGEDDGDRDRDRDYSGGRGDSYGRSGRENDYDRGGGGGRTRDRDGSRSFQR